MDIKKIFEGIVEYLQLLLKSPLPSWVLQTILVTIGVVLVYFLIEKIIAAWKITFAPIFYNPEERRRSKKRKRFAEYIVREMNRLDNLEEWNDYRFAELEAEIEAEGRWIPRNRLIPFRRVRTGLRREKSLSNALETSKDRIILLEGDPGSGKSIALRHLTQKLANQARKSNSTKSVIPIYINLRGLEINLASNINKQVIYDYIITSLNRANDRDIEEFLEQEFDRGIEDGNWLFLFDSFDEIPDILSSTEADTIISKYSEAITDFLQVMNQCRGIIASRYFRGPKHLQGPRFHILPLSEKRQLKLIKNAELPPIQEKELIGGLALAHEEIRTMVSNPMFLGLLCEYIRLGNQFPQNTYSVFEKYVTTRLDRDQDRLTRRFNLTTHEIRQLAETTAFCMTADEGLGLSPRRSSIHQALLRQGFNTTNGFHKILDALEYIKLARSEGSISSNEDRIFTFAHRRFQEYFATTVVLREPTRVTTIELLTNARWRETCVTLCQTQPFDKISAIVSKAENIIDQMAQSIRPSFPEDWDDSFERMMDRFEEPRFPQSFPWPNKLLHILGLLQDGFINRLDFLDEELRNTTGNILVVATVYGNHLDKKLSLEVGRVANEDVFQLLISNALNSKSQWLRNIAHQQLSKVQKITDKVEKWIREMLLELVYSSRLTRERFATHSYLSRLPNSAYFLSIHNHLLWTIYIDFSLLLTFFMISTVGLLLSNLNSFLATLAALGAYVIVFLLPLVIWQKFITKCEPPVHHRDEWILTVPPVHRRDGRV